MYKIINVAKHLCQLKNLFNLKKTKMSNSFENSRRTFAKEVRIVEVGPRDGLQNEKSHISTELKVDLVNQLQKAGCTYIEVGKPVLCIFRKNYACIYLLTKKIKS